MPRTSPQKSFSPPETGPVPSLSPSWWRDAVLYQIYPRSFADSSGSGIGDLAGITARLDYVAALGVDAVWISPFVASPQRDFGYDVSDYCAVDPLFGTLEDADRLIARAHQLGLRVVMDQVWSHSADRHPWFAQSRQSREGPMADWYVWADPRADGTPPNNWLSVFGGPAWTWDPRRRQYYLHHFLPEQPALNVRHRAVREALIAVGRFWIDRGVDGFRLDAVDFMAHDVALRDNPPRQDRPAAARPYSYQKHLYDLAQADTKGLLRSLRQALPVTRWHGEPPLLIAEVGSEPCQLAPFARAGAYTAAEGAEQAGELDLPAPVHLAYSLAMMKTAGTSQGLAEVFTRAHQQAEGGSLLWAFSNHDVVRVVSRWGGGDPASAKTFLALLCVLRGALCLYQGEELGLPEAVLDYDDLRDPVGLALWPKNPGRDGCRTPMPWQNAPGGGFSSTRPWLPVPAEHLALAVDQQQGLGEGCLRTAQALLAWRKACPALRSGDLSARAMDDQRLVIDRQMPGQKIRFCFNLSPNPAHLPELPFEGACGERWEPLPGEMRCLCPGETDRLRPWGAAMCVCEDNL